MHILARRLDLLAFALVTSLLLIAITPAAAQKPAATFTTYLPLILGARASVPSPIEQQVVDLINQARESNGCHVALTISPQLASAAAAHSQDMAINNVFSHTGSSGSTLVSRVTATGYDYLSLAENIAAGGNDDTAQAVVTAWLNSPSHRANILNCNLRETGVGFYHQPNDQANVRLDDNSLGGPFYYYWTQDFGTSAS